ncbi:MAG: rhomboid family intramembrane serine protease [Kofleriaceae bacterium]
MQRQRLAPEALRITRGAFILLFLQLGVSLVWLFSDLDTRARLATWAAPTPTSVWREGKLWTLATGPLLEPRFISLLFQGVVLWLFVPTLERFWGTARLLRFAAMTLLAGTIVGTLTGLGTGREVPMLGYDPFIYACIVAFGIIYARQPVQFFGVLPMTGRQLMFGILAFLVLMITLNGQWEDGAGIMAAIGLTVLITSPRYSPELAWQRFRRRRARAHLRVVEDEPAPRRRSRPDSKYLN